MNINIPYLQCYVRNAFLYNDFSNKDLTPVYVFGAKILINKPLLFICQLDNGAVFQGLPINAFVHRQDFEKIAETEEETLSLLQYWNLQSSEADVITYKYLEGYTVECKNRNDKWMSGKYLFTIDDCYKEANNTQVGYAEDSDAKSFNIIKLDNGWFCAYPNNYLLFHNLNHVEPYDKKNPPKYKPNSIDWNCEYVRI